MYIQIQKTISYTKEYQASLSIPKDNSQRQGIENLRAGTSNTGSNLPCPKQFSFALMFSKLYRCQIYS